MQRLVEERISAIQNRFLQSPLDDVIFDWGPWLREEKRELAPMVEEIGDRFAQAGVRFRLVLGQLCLQPVVQLLHHRPTVLLMEA